MRRDKVRRILEQIGSMRLWKANGQVWRAETSLDELQDEGLEGDGFRATFGTLLGRSWKIDLCGEVRIPNTSNETEFHVVANANVSIGSRYSHMLVVLFKFEADESGVPPPTEWGMAMLPAYFHKEVAEATRTIALQTATAAA